MKILHSEYGSSRGKGGYDHPFQIAKQPELLEAAKSRVAHLDAIYGVL
jgi:hypothetical protein